MRTGRPKLPLELLPADKEKLLLLARRPKTAQRVAVRSKIVLRAAEGRSNQEIARGLGVSGATVGKWRERFRLQGMEGLSDEPRPGAPRTITDVQVEEAVTRTLESLPVAATHWSTRSLAEAVGLSQSAVVRIWHSFGLQPHRSETFKLSTDPFLVEKIRDITGLYLNPPDRAIVLSIDEKSQVQALDRTQPILPLRPGLPEQRTSDYERHGTTSLFAALDVATGKVIGRCHRRHRHQEFLQFMDLVDCKLPADAQEVHVVLDNYGNPQDPQGDSLVCAASALSSAFHANQRVLDKSSGALVCGTHREADSARVVSERGEPGEGHPGVFGPLQRKSEAICMDGGRRPDPGKNSATL